MPELPEVECVRRTLASQVIGRRIEAVRVNRADVIVGSADAAALLAGQVVERIDRHGKQLALVAEDQRCIVVHLGMSGQLRLAIGKNTCPPAQPNKRPSTPAGSPHWTNQRSKPPPHCHVVWQLADNRELRFIDPRRFGGLWTYPTTDQRDRQRWSALGPDALSLTPGKLAETIGQTRRAIKAVLLDQAVVAGLGNIYVDELLFGCRLHPLTPGFAVDRPQIAAICRRARSLLHRAIKSGGSTLRDYVDAAGQAGGYQQRHRVYGRSGQRCLRRSCGATLASALVAGRTTVWCPACQPLTGSFPQSVR